MGGRERTAGYLNKEFPKLFAQGRCTETFIRIIASNTAQVTAHSYAQKISTVTVYGCQDGCCFPLTVTSYQQP
ncbi:hypothetical protein GCM10007052_17870 [Halioglobus japonicus]|nr:hypothetical protein GCM10007052_17870 [Halioglobus japonicus]